MADIVMPLRYIISASARWASVRIVCFRVILAGKLSTLIVWILIAGLVNRNLTSVEFF